MATATAPGHLRPKTRRWWSSVTREFVLESHHLKMLTLAAESWDRCEQAREVIDQLGLTYVDRFGAPRTRPEVAVERDSRLAFIKCVRSLDLDLAPPPSSRRTPGRY